MNFVSGIGTIFMLHRVQPTSNHEFAPNKDMAISPKFLEKFILQAKAKGYKFISLDYLVEAVQIGREDKLLVMTLDDGYRDNYTNAYPIFKKHNVPFTIYVTTSFPDGVAVLWWYVLEELILENDELELVGGTIFRCSTADEKLDCFTKVRQEILGLPSSNFLEHLNNLFGIYSIDWEKYTKEIAMDWEQIKTLANDPLVTIGAHTCSHVRLSNLLDSEVINEVKDSRDLIESHIGHKVEHFCYPYGARGDADQREFDIVRELNFKTATTTRSANVFLQHRKHLEALPRVALTNCFNWKDFRFNSLKRFLKGRMVTA